MSYLFMVSTCLVYDKNTLTLKVSEEEIAKRRAAWKQPALKATKGVLYKYAKSVKTAAEGCVTDE